MEVLIARIRRKLGSEIIRTIRGEGYALSLRALAPLHSLERRVRSIDAHDPQPELLEPPLPHRELEAVRGSVAELVERLRNALTNARRFASHAAHELRTPLTTIAGELELLSERAERDPALEKVRRHVHDLVELIQRLLILAHIVVVDSGAGIPEGERERVFDAFYRTPGARTGSALGHGLGLALIAHVADVHGGGARIEEADMGTGLCVELPLWASRGAGALRS